MCARSGEILVFDVGGSHVAAGVFRLWDESVANVHQVPVSFSITASDFFALSRLLLDAVRLDRATPTGVAVSIPNPFDHARGISYMEHKYAKLYGVNLRQGLSEALACDPCRIRFVHDARAFLLGELHRGAGIGATRSIGITLGTGVGAAFAIGEDIVLEEAGVPPGGEIWNLPYRGETVEAFVGTGAIQRKYQQLTGISASARDIASVAKGNTAARTTFDWFGRELGHVIRHTCLGFAPERIIVGGKISQAANLFLNSTREELSGLGIQLRGCRLLDIAPLVGAGMDWKQMHAGTKSLATTRINAIADTP